MTLTLLTHYLPTERENYQKLADLILPERDAYCGRYGYQHVVHKGPYKDASLYYAIQRLWKLYDHMQSAEATDFYWVLNLQSLITNHTKQITDCIKTDSGEIDEAHHFFIAHDANGLNAGSFLVRNNEWGREWIKFVAEQAPRVNHCWHEQKVMQIYEDHPFFKPFIKIIPQSCCNSYWYPDYSPWTIATEGCWKPGDLVLSIPGKNLAERLEMARSERWQKAIIR